eukprot:TRINITY_DN3345_c0_g1_i2.p1 TRINITY_DN3345_c0_g1~~TRINITY_DN3345_c0_g1_i2.p1  ORF type:complete len:434 (+),score=59.09 TRINITY_DN3345_c0_g1_i2:763-2064(+)
MENSWGNGVHDYRQHLKVVKQLVGKKLPGLGQSRFESLLHAFRLPIAELWSVASLLSAAFQQHVASAHVATFDELLFGYQPSADTKLDAERAGEPIPVVFIQRKPHPNGLLIYLLATCVKNSLKGKNVPFVLSIFPHLTAGDIRAQVTFQACVDAWPHQQLHYIADAFGSLKVANHVVDKGGQVTLSFSSIVEGRLWASLSFNLAKGTWRAAFISDRLLASCHALQPVAGGLMVYQHIVTSAFTANRKLPPVRVPPLPAAPAAPAAPAPAAPATAAPASAAAPAAPAAPAPAAPATAAPASAAPAPAAPAAAAPAAPAAPAPAAPAAAAPASAAPAPAAPAAAAPAAADVIPVLSEEMLQHLTVSKLKEICNKFNIKKGKDKLALIHAIRQRVVTVHAATSRVEEVTKILTSFMLQEQHLPTTSTRAFSTWST